MELLNTFGLDIRILTAQLITFVVFFFVLYRFAIKPISTFLEKRSAAINNSLDEADIAKESVEKAQETREEILSEAKREAQEILSNAESQANHRRSQIIKQANDEADDILKKNKVVIEEERSKVLKEAEKKIGHLTMLTTQALLEGSYDNVIDQKFIDNAISKLNIKDESK